MRRSKSAPLVMSLAPWGPFRFDFRRFYFAASGPDPYHTKWVSLSS